MNICIGKYYSPTTPWNSPRMIGFLSIEIDKKIGEFWGLPFLSENFGAICLWMTDRKNPA